MNPGVTAAEALAGAGIDPFEARMLLSFATGLARAALIAHPEAVLAEAAAATFRELAARRRAGEPIAYLVGERDFHDLRLRVTPDVLIPRPETEMLVDFALEKLPPQGTILDLGTGSGAIALAIRRQRPGARVTAVDRSPAALAVASGNARRLGLEAEFLEGSWYEPLGARRFDVIVSNPPYVAEGDRHLEEGDLRFEPRGALVGGSDGLDAVRTIAGAAPRHLNPGGWVAIEHGLGQDAAVRTLLAAAGLEFVASRTDLAGIARISVGKYNPD
ncbi:MAG: peptide chain release factor N(5)-glutamine methyltransferase [Proteobacteria bacterium]|nr:peptide chain release factor N(5)-glutamine methyltransferase [Pseudomonadota bacterium]